jgi:hypothetical protein
MLSLFGIEHHLVGLNGSQMLPYTVSDNIVKQSKVIKSVLNPFNDTDEYFKLVQSNYKNLSNNIFKDWSQRQDKKDPFVKDELLMKNNVLPFIHPNLIHYLMDDETIIVVKKNKTYLKKTNISPKVNDSIKFYISDKTIMAYQFIRALYEIDIMNKFFDDDGYLINNTIQFIVENNSPFNFYKNVRVTCKIPILKSQFHGIEFIDTEEDYNRSILQPKLSNLNNDYIYNWYIRKDNWYNEVYRENYIYELIYKMKYYDYINNNEKFKIEYMSKIVNITPELSKILLDSHENKDEYTVSMKHLLYVLDVHDKKRLCYLFMKEADETYKYDKESNKINDFNKDDLNIGLSNLELDENIYNDKNTTDYIIVNDELFINYRGIHILTKLITEKNFKKSSTSTNNYLNVFELYNKTGKAAVNSCKLLYILYKKSMIPGYNIDNYINYGLNNCEHIISNNKSIEDIDIVTDLISSIEINREDECLNTIIEKPVRKKTNKLHELNGYYGDPDNFDFVDEDKFNLFAANNKKFTVSTQILTPNLISYFINKEYAILEVNKNKNYLTSSNDSTNRIEISKQIKFIYELVEVIKQIKNKNKKSPFKDWFDLNNSNDNIEIICEKSIKNIYNKQISVRIDFTFIIKNIIPNKNYYFGVEFLEMATHKSQENNLDYSELSRHHKINLNEDLHYGNMFYVWEDNWKDNNYRFEYVKHMESVLTKLKSVDLTSQKRFAVKYFNEYLHNEETSKMIIEAYLDEYNHILEYDFIIKQFLIKNNLDEFKETFMKQCDRITELKNCENYYKYIDGDFMINSHGLYIMTLIIEKRNFELYEDYMKIYHIYGYISQANVDAINKIHGLMEEILTDKNNKNYGLDHLSKTTI